MGNKGAKSKKKPSTIQNVNRENWPVSSDLQSTLKPKPTLTERDLDFLNKQTGQSKDDIKEIFEAFLVNNADGQLTKKEFVRLYSHLRPESPEKLDQISNFIFRAFDTDNNGTIDFNEFMIGYSLTTRGDLKTKLEYAFNIYDADNSGYLDREELREVIFGMLDLLGADKKASDVALLAEQCMQELDTSNDGKVSKEEFIEGLSKNYSMRALLSPFN